MKKVSGIAGLAMMICATTTAMAGPQAGLSSAFTKATAEFQLPIIQVLNGVNGQNAEVVYTPTGSFYTDGNGNWTEQGNDGAIFRFREERRDAWSVYLRDDSRGVNLQLDLHKRKIKYSDDNGQSFDLYTITDAQARTFGNNNQGQIGEAASSVFVEYSCNEGIPLTVEYMTIGDRTSAIMTHDGYQIPELPQVRSGSGVQYSDGRNVLHTKGDFAYVNLDGIEDNCTRVN